MRKQATRRILRRRREMDEIMRRRLGGGKNRELRKNKKVRRESRG